VVNAHEPYPSKLFSASTVRVMARTRQTAVTHRSHPAILTCSSPLILSLASFLFHRSRAFLMLLHFIYIIPLSLR